MQITEEIKSFIRQHIKSPRQLEVLLILSKEPERAWTARDIGAQVGLEDTASTNRLLGLWAKGFVDVIESPTRAYRYKPLDGKTDLLLRELADIYAQDSRRVVGLIDLDVDGPPG